MDLVLQKNNIFKDNAFNVVYILKLLQCALFTARSDWTLLFRLAKKEFLSSREWFCYLDIFAFLSTFLLPSSISSSTPPLPNPLNQISTIVFLIRNLIFYITLKALCRTKFNAIRSSMSLVQTFIPIPKQFRRNQCSLLML